VEASTPARFGPTKTAAPTAVAPSPGRKRRDVSSSCAFTRLVVDRLVAAVGEGAATCARRAATPTDARLLRLAQTDPERDARASGTTLPRLCRSLAPLVPAACSTQYTATVAGPLKRAGAGFLSRQHAGFCLAPTRISRRQDSTWSCRVLRDELRHAGLRPLDHGESARARATRSSVRTSSGGRAGWCLRVEPQQPRGRPGSRGAQVSPPRPKLRATARPPSGRRRPPVVVERPGANRAWAGSPWPPPRARAASRCCGSTRRTPGRAATRGPDTGRGRAAALSP